MAVFINIKTTEKTHTCSVGYVEIHLSIRMQACSSFVFSCQLVTIFSFSLYCIWISEVSFKPFHEVFDLVSLL